MAWGKTVSGVGKFAGKTGWSWFAKLRFLFLSLIFGVMLMNSILISIQDRNIETGVKYLGFKFLLVTEQLGEHSNNIIEQEGVYDGSTGFFKGVWNMLKNFYWIFESLFIIYIWCKVLAYVVLHGVLWDSSKVSVSWALAVLIFFCVQIITILAFTDKPLVTPFLAFWDFGKALPYMFKPISGITDKLIDTGKDLLSNNTVK